MKIKLFFSLLLISISSISAQDMSNFELLKSKGDVPNEFNKSSALKVKEDVKAVSKDQSRTDQKAEKLFALESNYLIDGMLESGMVLYNDELSAYVAKVADEVLKNNKELRNNLRFYILKSQAVNAFATDRGSIFITIGLLAQIENEAQLAFVLSHEIVHFQKKHAKTGFVENKRIEQGRGEYKRTKWNKEISKNKYSKELELEADIEGLKIFLNTKYSLKEVHSVFNVLQYAHLPIEDVAFDTTYFNSEFFVLPESLNKKEIKAIEAADDEDDESHTHPNINKRRAIMSDELEGKSDEGKLIFIVSEKDFYRTQSLARFELSYLYTKDRMYGEAIYNSYVLLKKNPDNEFLKINIAYALYALSKYKNDGKIHSVLTDYDDVEGESQRVHYLFDEMDKKTLNTLAVKNIWELKQSIKNNTFLDAIAENSIKELLLESGARKSDYKKKHPKNKEGNEAVEKNNEEEESKYDKIVKIKDDTEGYLKYAFVDLFQNEEFAELMSKYEKEYVKEAKGEKTDKQERIEHKKLEKKGRALGVEKIVMVAPDYKKYDLRKKVITQHEYSEYKKEDFVKLNQFCAEKRGIELVILSNTYFESTDQYNDISLLTDWMDERLDHKNVRIFPYCKMYTDELSTKYGTEHFGWTGMYAIHAQKNIRWGYLVLACIYYGIGIPIGIYQALTPENHTFYYTYVANVTNYNLLMAKEDYVKIKDNKDLMKSYVYDSYNQIKSSKKSSKKIAEESAE